MEDLKECLKAAYSYESRAGHDAEDLSTELLGMVQVSDVKIYEIYQDTAGNYWYKTRYKKDGKFISEYEYIFGKKRKRRRKAERRYLNEEFDERRRDRRGADRGERQDHEDTDQGGEGLGDREVV